MGQAIKAQTRSITTGSVQTLYLDEKDAALVKGKNAIIVDDVVSTGSTLEGMQEALTLAGAKVWKIASVFTEGDRDWSHIIALGNLPVFKS